MSRRRPTRSEIRRDVSVFSGKDNCGGFGESKISHKIVLKTMSGEDILHLLALGYIE